MPAQPFETTISDIKQFKRCRQEWDFGSVNRQGLMLAHKPLAFSFGELVHKALEVYYMNGEDPAAYFVDAIQDTINEADSDEEKDELVEVMEMGKYMLTAYQYWAIQHDDFTPISAEQRHTLKLNDGTPGKYFAFRYDMLVRRNNKLWIHDFKTAKRMPADDHGEFLMYDDQAVAYQWALEEVLGEPIAGFMYTYLWKRMPTMPKPLKSGKGLQQRSNLVCTAQAYLDTVVDYGFDPIEYIEFANSLRDNYDGKWFGRLYVTANPQQRQTHRENIVALVDEMANNPFIYPSPHFIGCKTCQYRTPCEAIRSGFKPNMSIDYVEKEERE